ncbi:MAG: hypothetical protein IKH21_04185 [Clostridia bacterium]|nr:hypothetical protein [Clostridia bacterium]MBR6428165.1 hypothetical protein [Clostridia bacterium]
MNGKNYLMSAAIAVIASGAMLLLPACAEDKASEQTASINQQTEAVTQAPTESVLEETVQPSETAEPDDNVDALNNVEMYSCGEVKTNESVRFSTNEGLLNDTKTIEFAGNKYELKYTRTIEYVLLNTVVDEYEIEVNNVFPVYVSDMGHVELLPDGTPYAIRTKSAGKINVKNCQNGEDVRKAVEEVFKDEIDFSAFNVCKIEGPSPELDHIFYRIIWYKEISGILTNSYVSVSLDHDGNVRDLWMTNNVDLGLDNVPDNISVDDYTDAFEAKIKEFFGEYLIEFKIDKDSARLTNIKGSPCIDVEYIVKVGGEGFIDPLFDSVDMVAVIKP